MAPWFGRGAIFVLGGASNRRLAGPHDPQVCSRQRQTGPVRMHRTPQEGLMGSLKIFALASCAFLTSWAGTPCYSAPANATSAGQGQTAAEKKASSKDVPIGVPALPRGKKLVLKDGTFQLVRDYRRNGERV